LALNFVNLLCFHVKPVLESWGLKIGTVGTTGVDGFAERLRQYWDSETNSHYNYFRDYQPHKGRYVQSDPIGLYGGINTFAYVDGNPLANFDPNGQSWIAKIAGCAVGFAAGYYAGDSIRGTIRDFNELRKKRSAKSDCGSESKEVTPNTQSGYSGGLVGDALSVTGENLIKLVSRP
jgi:RHS repeat-associated protein